MSRPQFQLWAGQDDTVQPQELLHLVKTFQKRHRERTRYAALTEMLLLAAALDRGKRDRHAMDRTRTRRAATDGMRVNDRYETE